MTATTAEPEEISIELPELRLSARAWGPAEGEPILALHGWLDNASTFDRLAPLLPGCRLVAIDLPGHGRSSHRGHSTYYLLDYVADALTAATALGWTRYALLGHSLGAGVAALCAGAYPERITRLALIEGLMPLTDDPKEAATRLRTALDREARGRSNGRPPYPTLEAAAAARSRATGLSVDAAQVLVKRALEEVDGGWRWRTDPRLRWPSRIRLSDIQVRSFLSAIACPTKLVTGDRGLPMLLPDFAERCTWIPGLERAQLSGGHHLHLEDATTVAVVLAPFLAPSS